MSHIQTRRTLIAPELRQWKGEGFLILRNLFRREEMEALSEEAWKLTYQRDLIDKRNLRCRFQPTHDGAECLWETFDPIIDISPLCEECAFDVRLLDVLHDLYG